METCDHCSVLKPTSHIDLPMTFELRTTFSKIDLAATQGCLFCQVVSNLSHRYLSSKASENLKDSKQFQHRGQDIIVQRKVEPGVQIQNLQEPADTIQAHSKAKKGLYVTIPEIYVVLPDGKDESRCTHMFEICETDGK